MTAKKSTGVTQASAKPRKLLKGGVSPDVGKATQFKPGQSGNPAGPKPGYKHISTHIQELLNDEGFSATIREGIQIKEYKGAPLKAILRALAIKAMAGDTKAFDALAKYGYGTKVDVTTDGQPLTNPYAALTVDELRKLAQGR